MTKRDERRFKKNDVILVPSGKGEVPALIRRVGGDESNSSDRSTVYYDLIDSKGELQSGGHFRGEYEMGDVKKVDFANVRKVVDLPPDVQKVAQAYEIRKREHMLADRKRLGEREEDPETHPAYGNVQVSRVSGHTALFGSPFQHQHYMKLTFRRCSRRRSLGRDWNFGDGVHLLEINLSEAQWAHMVASAGLGGGVPCTLAYVGGQKMEDCPDQAEIERFHEDLELAAEKSVEFMEDALTQMKALVDDKAPSKEKRKAVFQAMDRARRQLDDSVPFIARQLRERMDTIVQEGKTELEAFAHSTIVETGIAQLAESMGKNSKVLNLPASQKPGEISGPDVAAGMGGILKGVPAKLVHSCEGKQIRARDEAQTSGPPITIYRCTDCGKEST